jgi:carboxypeptidase T
MSRHDVKTTTVGERVDSPMVYPNWTDGVYHDYEGTLSLLRSFNVSYPGLVYVFSIGKSVQGRDIWCLRVTNEANTSLKNICVFDGCHHGNEWEGGEACLYNAHLLLLNYAKNQTISTLLNSTEVYLIPLVNPDGREKDTRWNANGIDLNRNYDVNFGRFLGHSLRIGRMFGVIDYLGWPQYHIYWTKAGWHPFSEPETQALSRFMEQLDQDRFSFYLCFHTAVHVFAAPSYVVWHSDYTVSTEQKAVFEYAKNWVQNHTQYSAAPNKDRFGVGDSISWVFKEFQKPSFYFEILSKEYEPYCGHGPHDRLNYWMQTTVPVVIYLLVNAQNLHDWTLPTS